MTGLLWKWVRDQMDQYGGVPYTFKEVVFGQQRMSLEPTFFRRLFNAAMSSSKNQGMRCYCRMLCAASTMTAFVVGGSNRQRVMRNDWDICWLAICHFVLLTTLWTWKHYVSTIRSCSGHLYVRTEVASTCPCSALRPLWCHWKAGPPVKKQDQRRVDHISSQRQTHDCNSSLCQNLWRPHHHNP